MEVRIGRKPDIVKLAKPFAEGGEARIYRLDDQVVKIYKLPNDPELQDDAAAIAAARIRLVVAQRKLPLMPKDLPKTIAAPQELVRDPVSGFVIGFTAPFVKAQCILADLKTSNNPVADERVMEIFRSMKILVQAMHDRGIVLGDFNDKNVLVNSNTAYLIDVDSAQFAPFRTKVFTEQFVDPNLCKKSDAGDILELAELHNKESDWYAWWVMLFQTLLGVHPYGGMHKPKDKSKKVPPALRGLRHVSVYDSDVIYPKNARELNTIPKTLEKFFRMVFERGGRPVPPDALFNGFRFEADGNFDCARSVILSSQKKTIAGGRLATKVIFAGDGVIVAAASCDHELVCLHLRKNTLCRNNTPMMTLKNVDGLDFYAAGMQSAIGRKNEVIAASAEWNTRITINVKQGLRQRSLLTGSQNGLVYYDDAFKMLTGKAKPFVRVLDISKDVMPLDFWADGDYLLVLFAENGKLKCLLHQTVWDRTLFCETCSYVLPQDVSEAYGYVGVNRAWLFLKHGQSVMCDVFDERGVLVNHIEDDLVWMGNISDKCAFKTHLFSPEKTSVCRITVDGNDVSVKNFPSDELLDSRLIMDGNSLFAVNKNSIRQLSLG